MAFIDQYTLSRDVSFQQRIEAATVKAAVAVAGEADTVAFHPSRLKLATRVLAKASEFALLFALGAATDATVAAAAGVPPVQANVTDAQLDTVVTAQWSAIAGAREWPRLRSSAPRRPASSWRMTRYMRLRRFFLALALALLPTLASAQISFVGGAGGNAINAGSVTVTLPGGMATNDLIVVAFGVGDDDFTQPTLAITTAGYTEVTSSTCSADGGTGGDGNLAVFYKFHNGSDTTVQTTAAGTGADSSVAVSVLVLRGVALAGDGGPFDTTFTQATATSGGDPDPPSIDHTGAAGVWTVIAGALGNAAALTLTGPTNYTTNFRNDVGNDTFDTSTGLGYRTNPVDPEDPGVMTDSGAGVAWCAVTMALKEAPAVTCTAGLNLTLLGVGGCP